jgi:large repetitive protein
MGNRSTAPARGHRRYGSTRGRALWLVVLTMFSLIALPAAAAQADDTWSGLSTTSALWSDTNNWVGNVAPAGAAGTLTFPLLTGCAAPETCYTSHNDLSGISATGLVFSNTAGQYRILGNGLSVGTGGITDNAGSGTGNVINTPLTLSGTQSWLIGNGFGPNYNSLSLASPANVTGSVPLNVTFQPNAGTSTTGDLFVGVNMEVGNVAVTGAGGLHIGTASTPGSVNGINGHAVALSGNARLVANPGATVGALTVTGSQLQVGTSASNTGSSTTLGVTGAFSIDSASTTTALINDNGSTPGTDFSQLSATGNITLNGTLKVDQGPGSGGCVALNKGDVATLFTTTGSLTGTFTGVPDGTVVTMASSCQSTTQQVRINYTASGVTATVVSGTTPTTTTLATPNPTAASTNQRVTLTATVTTNTNGNVAPMGTAAFSANGSGIPGCGSQPVTSTGSTGTATCTTSFAAAHSPESLTAAFTGASGSGQVGSTSAAQSLTVSKGSTATKLAASSTSLAAGGSVTYTATVTPNVSGESTPSGTVAFMDNGRPISGCPAQPLTTGSSTATCAVSYAGAGAHSITAVYSGDASFSGSTSPATTVTVSAPAVKKSTGRLLGPAGRFRVTGRTIRFTVKCQSKVLCRGGFTLTVTLRGKNKKLTTVRCASGSFRIRANRSAALRVTLSGACLRLLRAQANHRLTVVYTSKSQTGQAGQRNRVTLLLG